MKNAMPPLHKFCNTLPTHDKTCPPYDSAAPFRLSISPVDNLSCNNSTIGAARSRKSSTKSGMRATSPNT